MLVILCYLGVMETVGYKRVPGLTTWRSDFDWKKPFAYLLNYSEKKACKERNGKLVTATYFS